MDIYDSNDKSDAPSIGINNVTVPIIWYRSENMMNTSPVKLWFFKLYSMKTKILNFMILINFFSLILFWTWSKMNLLPLHYHGLNCCPISILNLLHTNLLNPEINHPLSSRNKTIQYVLIMVGQACRTCHVPVFELQSRIHWGLILIMLSL